MKKKGIILAGGYGSRLRPLTRVVSKQLLPVYDKPLIYYPLSVLMLGDIREIMIVTSPEDEYLFKKLLGDGRQLGLSISYRKQQEPRGIPEAFTLCSDFIGNDRVTLILGDNIFFGDELAKLMKTMSLFEKKASILAYQVNDPERYGVVNFDSAGRVRSLEEKPKVPKSRYAITGLYFVDSESIDITRRLKPSERGELEIIEILNYYLNQKRLNVEIMGRGMAWLDTGTHHSLLEASQFISVIEKRQGLKIACLEEIAYSKGWISRDHIIEALKYYQNEYGEYLKKLL